MQAWIDARKRYHLSHAKVQMARELGKKNMSEYQYYEFQALDRPLTQTQMEELRAHSSRARITSTSFVNVYNWGSFKGDADKWVEDYFDAFFYIANWGTRQLSFRIPGKLIDRDAIEDYCGNEGLSCATKNEVVILSFYSEEEYGGEWEEGEGWLPDLIPLRSDLMRGDLRCLYLGWLAAVQSGQLEDDAVEPPVPPGLGKLSAPLESLADFLRIDGDLLAVAAETSPQEQAAANTRAEIAGWVANMPANEKDAALIALIEGNTPHFAEEFRQRAARAIQDACPAPSEHNQGERRTVGELVARAETIAKINQAREAEARAQAKAKREREEAESRRRYLESLAGKEDETWAKIAALIATKQPNKYAEAVTLLQDLRDAAALGGKGGEFSRRMSVLYDEHARKFSLIERFRKANLMG